jgi:hypothetical protein
MEPKNHAVPCYNQVARLELLSAGMTSGPVSPMTTLASMQMHKQFFPKNTDTSLSALFAFFRVENTVKNALTAQKQAFWHPESNRYCFTPFTLFHCEQQRFFAIITV